MQSIRSFLLRMGGLGVYSSKARGVFFCGRTKSKNQRASFFGVLLKHKIRGDFIFLVLGWLGIGPSWAQIRVVNSRNLFRLNFVLVCLLSAAVPAGGQVRIVTYNSNNGSSGDSTPRAGVSTILDALSYQNRPGFARPVDILLLQESASVTSTTQDFVNLLNGLHGGGYARGSSNAATSGSGRPTVVYNTNVVQLIAEVAINSTNTSGAARATMRYQFRPVGYDSSADFYVYNSHFKASDTSNDRTRRGVEAAQIRTNADALGEGAHIIYAGDLNLYSSTEQAFVNFTNTGAGQAFDPVNRVGSWSDNNSFRDVHTQSPVTNSQFDGQVTGGMDDRFDFQLVTGALMSGRGFAYITNSYWAFGNTGTHQLNGEITTGNPEALRAYLPGYSAARASAVLTAITESSDHLPVVADYQVPARMALAVTAPPERILRGATVSLAASVSNAAAVTVPAGADRLDFTWSGSGGLTGSGSGTAQPQGPGQAAGPAWNTGTAGAMTGTLTVTTSSPQAFPASLTTNVSTTVLDPASASFASGVTTNALTVDLGTVVAGAAAPSATFQVYNRASSNGMALTAGLDVDGVTPPAGGAGPAGVSLATGRVAAGGSVQGTVSLATTSAGSFERVFTVQVSDENVPGEGLRSLALTVKGTVTAAQTPLESWAAGYGLTEANAAAGADPDGDGLANLAEYALAGVPTNSSTSILPVVSTLTTNGTNWLRFAYRARTNDAALVIQPVFKVNLTETNWSTNGVVQKVSGQSAGDGVHEEQVWQTPVGAEARRFLKLNISR